MQTEKNLFRRILPVLAASLAIALSLTGCGKTGKLDEGNCKCSISFTDIPKELSMLEENVLQNFEINVTLKNVINEKMYYINLTQDNDFSQEISLNPGVYQVCSVSSTQSSNTGISMAADAESIELSEDDSAALHVYVDNREEFTKHWMSVQPMPEMLLADKFDGLIQINRQVIDLRADDATQLISQLDVSHDSPVSAYQKITLTDYEMGVEITLQNMDSEAADWQDCKLVEIYVFKNNVVFPQGVTLGMAPKNVCDISDGLYGEPDQFTGSLLYGWGFDDTCAVYQDPESGDKLTIDLNAGGSSVRNIRYQLAQYED